MDFVSRLLAVLETAPTGTVEHVIRREFGGRRVYIASTTGRDKVRQLIDCGLCSRTARWKVRGY